MIKLYKPSLNIRMSLLIGALLAFLAFSYMPGTTRYRVDELFAITADSETDIFLAVLQPMSGPYQTISQSSVTSLADWQAHSITGNDFVNVVANSITLQPGQTTEIVYTYHAAIRRGSVKWEQEYLPEHLLPEANIESDNPLIRAEAARFALEQPSQRARSIYTHVAEYLSWPEGSRINVQPSALAALESGVGVCAEFANLTTALSRAAGVPAVSISGLAMPELLPLTKKQAQWNHPAAAHGWVELYTDTSWTMADASWAGKARQDAYFGRSDGRHLSFGPTAHEQEVYSRVLEWAEGQGTPVGGMSAPNKFIAAATSADTQVTPTVTITQELDSRHPIALATFILGSMMACAAITALTRFLAKP